MCLILFAHETHPRYRLVLGANRDERHGRPTAPLGRWPDAPGVVAGRDLEAGGSWMGVTEAGRWAAVTNVRERSLPGDHRSRGELVGAFLTGEEPAAGYAAMVSERGGEYQGFNLLVGDRGGVHWISNRSGLGPVALEPGVYGVSNHLLDTPWPKVTRGREALRALVQRDPAPAALLDLLLDRVVAADELLPDTGVGTALERVLAPAFITGAEYGTRSSTALLLERGGGGVIVERSFGAGGVRGEERTVVLPRPVEDQKTIR